MCFQFQMQSPQIQIQTAFLSLKFFGHAYMHVPSQLHSQHHPKNFTGGFPAPGRVLCSPQHPQLTKHQQQQEGSDTRTLRGPSRLHPHRLQIAPPGACFSMSWMQMVTGLCCEPWTHPAVLLQLTESYSQREAVMLPMVHLLRQQRHRFYFSRDLSMVRVSCFLKGGNFSLLPLFPTSPC